MVKIVFLADTHLGFDFPMHPKKSKRRRGPDFFTNFDRVISYSQENNVDLVIHGGDLFYRTLVPQPIVDMVYDRIGNLAQFGIPIVIVPGNHESSKLPLSLFLHHPNIHYFTKTQVFKFNFKNINLDIAGFPCVRKDIKTRFSGIVNELQPQLSANADIKLLCMHQTVEGAVVGPSDYVFKNGKDIIPKGDLPIDYNLILSGHIHRSQVLHESEKSTIVIYPGSVEKTAFAEKNEIKGFYQITIDDNLSIEFNFIPLPARPMEDIYLSEMSYTNNSLKREIVEKVSILSPDSIIRFKLKNSENLNLLNVKFLDEIIPWSMNYQIHGLPDYSENNKSKI